MKIKVIDMCPFMGLSYEDEIGEIHRGGDGLSKEESNRIDIYFNKYNGQAFSREKSIELAQMALDNALIPEGWSPK